MMMDMFMAEIVMMASQMCTYFQTNQVVYIKYAQLFKCQPYLIQ